MSDYVNTNASGLTTLNAANKLKEQRTSSGQGNGPTEEGIKLPPLPENSNIRIYVDKDQGDRPRDEPRPHRQTSRGFSMRTIWALGAGLVSGAAAWFATNVHVRNKLFELDVASEQKSVEIITGKGGLGASVADAGAGVATHSLMPMNGLGNFGTGISAPLIEQFAHDSIIRENPEKYKFAKWMRNIGGRSNFGLGVGVAVGTAVGLATYALMSDKKGHANNVEKSGDWQSKVDNEKDQVRDLG